MSHLTINDLKAGLVSLGISLPQTDDENEYIKLYKKHVSPLKNIQIKQTSRYNQLSSDDDEDDDYDLSAKNVYTAKSQVVTTMSEKSFNESEVYSLSDDQLYKELSKLNVTVGPIVDSTRKIYQRKLIKLLGGDVVDSSFNGDVDNEEEYSDNDSEQYTTKEKDTSYSASMSKSSTAQSPSSTLRSRITTEKISSALDNSLAFDHDRHTPSPRPSLRTASTTTTSSSSTKYLSSGKTLRESTSIRHTYSYPFQKEQSPGVSYSVLGRFLVKLLFILILLTALYFTYQYLYSESPLKGLKHLAEQAAELANGETKKGAKMKSKP